MDAYAYSLVYGDDPYAPGYDGPNPEDYLPMIERERLPPEYLLFP